MEKMETSCKLNPNFKFDSFVVGNCNHLAYASARAVADHRSGHPLFVYGGVGLGKTHLLHAIAHAVNEQGANVCPLLVSSEQFVDEMVSCIKSDRMQRFRDYYRGTDILLMDDIQFLENKTRSQEELSHTMSELTHQQKQLVFTSDAAPREIPGLAERLRSRFEAALLIELLPTDLETRFAILAKKAQSMADPISEDVLAYIAVHTGPSVRQLEGALVRLIAYSSCTDVEITLPIAEKVLGGMFESPRPPITIDSIQAVVAAHFGIPKAHLKARRRDHSIAFPRQVGMYLARRLTDASFPRIARAFGVHHTTAIYAVNKIDKLRQTDRAIRALLEGWTERLQSQTDAPAEG
jgi:chromosomal replication initiator protein